MHKQPNLISLFQCAEPYLTNHLLDNINAKKIDNLHAFLPQLNMVNYEFRLAQSGSRVDSNIMVWRYEAPILLNWLADKTTAFYRQLLLWVQDWIDPKLSFHLMIQNIWIMYDLKEDEDEIPEPWIVFSFSEFNIEKEAYLSIIKSIASYFTNDFKLSHWSILDKIYSNLEQGQSVPAIGFQNRNMNSMRLGVKEFFDSSQMISYLNRIGWTGDIEFIQQHYAQFIKASSYSMISMTFNENLLPVLGVECYMDEQENLTHSTKFLRGLVEKGLCSEEKYQALIHWIGDNNDEQRFNTLDKNARNTKNFIRRWLLEVKLLVEPKEPAKAKAYVLINQCELKIV